MDDTLILDLDQRGGGALDLLLALARAQKMDSGKSRSCSRSTSIWASSTAPTRCG